VLEREKAKKGGSVQSLERAFELLERLADLGGASGLSELAAASGLPLTTIHRLMGTLVKKGYVRHEHSRRYVLGPRLIRLGDTASRMLGSWATPHLGDLVELTGETANIAVLEGDQVVYLAQVPGRHSMRMFTEPGRRFDPHCTAVGKAMMALLSDQQVRSIMSRTGMEAKTANTITDSDLLIAQLETIRKWGYALDEGEQEMGVRCVAISIPNIPSLAAISVSGPRSRMTGARIKEVLPVLKRVARELSEEFNDGSGDG
jgi:IclR family acetate operon transcriptional repressor